VCVCVCVCVCMGVGVGNGVQTLTMSVKMARIRLLTQQIRCLFHSIIVYVTQLVQKGRLLTNSMQHSPS